MDNRTKLAILCIDEHTKDDNGNIVDTKHHYYKETNYLPNRAPNGLAFSSLPEEAYRFACREYAQNFRDGHQQLHSARIIEVEH